MTCGLLARCSESVGGWDHGRGSLVDGVDDFGVVDAAEVDRGDAEVGVPELALDDDQGDAFSRHLDGVGVTELVGGEPSPDTGLLGGVA